MSMIFSSSTLAVEYVSLLSLIPCANNASQHSKPQIGKLVASLREFGWTNPIIVDERGNVLCGHGRLMAARQMGLTEVPIIKLAHMSEAQKRAYILADNRIAEQAS